MKPAAYYQTCLAALNPGFRSEWPEIAGAYEVRAYHNLNHLEEMLAHLPELLPAAARAGEVIPDPIFAVALIYHDLVYRAGRKDNEALSAERAVDFLQRCKVDQADQARCRDLIMATKTHEATTEEEALLVDLDLAVLARDETGYDSYARAVRKEFNLFPDFLYRPGRKKALLHFLAKPFIYHSPVAREQWELKARTNIERELNRL